MEQLSDDELDHAAEEDSDKEDQDLDKMFGAWLGELDKLTQSLDDGKPEAVQKAPLRQETNMANFSYRMSIYNINEALNQGGDGVDLDALMADLCSIEQELSTIGKPSSSSSSSSSSRLGVPSDGAKLRQKPPAGRSQSMKGSGGGGSLSAGSSTRVSPASTVRASGPHARPQLASNFSLDDITAQLERASVSMDEAARQSSVSPSSLPPVAPSSSSSSTSLGSATTLQRPASHARQHRRTGSVGAVSDQEARSFTRAARSSAGSSSATSMEALDVGGPSSPSPLSLEMEQQLKLIPIQRDGQGGGQPTTEEEQAAKLKAEKIRVALEKIKEAQVKKLVIRVHLSDESSKTMMVDERQTVRQVLDSLLDKSHCGYSPDWSLVETINELQMERIFEDHENLVENLLNWTRDSQNKLMFIERIEKYALFKNPQNYLLGRKETCEMADRNKEALLEECFGGSSVSVPEIEGVLWLKEDGKKSWKKRYFLLRASGIYYVPKGKAKTSRDLVCFLQLEHVNIYYGMDYRSKYKSPTDYCLVLKHPQIQKKSQYIKYLCCDDVRTLHQWVNGIRIAKYGKQLYVNYQEAMKRTEAAYDWSSLSSSSIKSGSSSSSLPESQSNHSSQSDSGVSEGTSSGHVRSQSAVSSIFSEAWKRGNQIEETTKVRMEPARASYPLQLPALSHHTLPHSHHTLPHSHHTLPHSHTRSSYSGGATVESPQSSPSPPSPPPPPPPPPAMANQAYHSPPTTFTKYSTLARLQSTSGSQPASQYKQQIPMMQQLSMMQQHQLSMMPPTPPPQSIKPHMAANMAANMVQQQQQQQQPPPPPPPPPPPMPAPGSAMAVLRLGPPSPGVPEFVPPPPHCQQVLPPPPVQSHLQANGMLPPPPAEQPKYPALTTNGLQQFLAQKFPNMSYDFTPPVDDLDSPPPPPPPPMSPPPGPPLAPPKTFSGCFTPQTSLKLAGSMVSPVSPTPAQMKKQHSLSAVHSPSQPPPTLPKQHSFATKVPPLSSAPLSPTPGSSLVKQIVNQFPGSTSPGQSGPLSPPVVKAKPRWQPGQPAQPQSPEFPPPPPESTLDFPLPPPPPLDPTPLATPLPSGKSGGSPIKKSPSTSSNSSTGSTGKRPPPTPQRNSSIRSNSSVEYQESKKVEDLVSMFAQPSQASSNPAPASNSLSTPASASGSPSKEPRAPPKPGKINLANLPLALQGKSGQGPGQYRQSSSDFPSPPPEFDYFPPPPPDSELLPPPPLPVEMHTGAPKVAVVNPQPQLHHAHSHSHHHPGTGNANTTSWKSSSLKKAPPPTMHRRSSGPPDPLVLSPPPQQMPLQPFAPIPLQPFAPPCSIPLQPFVPPCSIPLQPFVPPCSIPLQPYAHPVAIPPHSSHIPPTSPKSTPLVNFQPNFLEDLNRTLKRKSISRQGSLTSSRISAKLDPLAPMTTMDDMALPPPPPELMLDHPRKGGGGGSGGYMSSNISGYATLRKGPKPAPPKRDQNTKLTGEW
ncbi:ras-associated and pleckstrin homology domains-containing protein 1a isoform X2 [Clupea harengus]|uniref:Ras-associated and pleckstrin homology domains-containing protein 1a isoform X2 n=1 Tax=Clupea harengus TaxID=7950 RepID=A0A6P8GRT1_CLUHA|nr:ras-associated and pleckstrin homology domains-containing protein 1a isoform X2 [Clupea harengus]